VGDFVLSGSKARPGPADGRAPFVDGISGEAYAVETIAQRVDWLARALGHKLGWEPGKWSPSDKVVAILSLNTVSN
jgi:hypothetical protein